MVSFWPFDSNENGLGDSEIIQKNHLTSGQKIRTGRLKETIKKDHHVKMTDIIFGDILCGYLKKILNSCNRQS